MMFSSFTGVKTRYSLIRFLLGTSFILVVLTGERESHTSETRFLSVSCGGMIS